MFLLPSAESAVCTDRWRSPLNTRAAGKGGDSSGKISCFRGPGKQLHQPSYSQNYNPRESLESKLLKYLLLFSFPNALILVLETLRHGSRTCLHQRLMHTLNFALRDQLQSVSLSKHSSASSQTSRGIQGAAPACPQTATQLRKQSQTLPPKFLSLPCLLLERGCDEQSGCA